MNWDEVIERNGEALKRMLVALAAMAGLLDAARFGLPRDIHRALLGPLRAAEAAARRLPPSPSGSDSVEAVWLRRRFAALVRVIERLIRRLLEAAPSPVRRPRREVRRSLAARPFRSRAIDFADTS